jgi:hypothetical protein
MLRGPDRASASGRPDEPDPDNAGGGSEYHIFRVSTFFPALDLSRRNYDCTGWKK